MKSIPHPRKNRFQDGGKTTRKAHGTGTSASGPASGPGGLPRTAQTVPCGSAPKKESVRRGNVPCGLAPQERKVGGPLRCPFTPYPPSAAQAAERGGNRPVLAHRPSPPARQAGRGASRERRKTFPAGRGGFRERRAKRLLRTGSGGGCPANHIITSPARGRGRSRIRGAN